MQIRGLVKGSVWDYENGFYWFSSKSRLNKMLAHYELLRVKGFENFKLIKGNVFDTLPNYLEKHPETRLSFLHLDMDVKEPTDFALELLYERVVPGGLIVFDDYNAVAGETLSVDEFVSKHRLKVEKLSFYNLPSFIRKPC